MYYDPLPYLDYVKIGKKKYYSVPKPMPIPVKTKSFWERLIGKTHPQARPPLVSILPEKAEQIQRYNDAVRIFNNQPSFNKQATQLKIYQQKVRQLSQIEQNMLHLSTTVHRMDEELQTNNYLKQFLIIEGGLGISKHKMALLHQNHIYNATQVSYHREWPKGIGPKQHLPICEWRKELQKTFVYVPNAAYQQKTQAKLLKQHPEIRRKKREEINKCAENIVLTSKLLQTFSQVFEQTHATFKADWDNHLNE